MIKCNQVFYSQLLFLANSRIYGKKASGFVHQTNCFASCVFMFFICRSFKVTRLRILPPYILPTATEVDLSTSRLFERLSRINERRKQSLFKGRFARKSVSLFKVSSGGRCKRRLYSHAD